MSSTEMLIGFKLSKILIATLLFGLIIYMWSRPMMTGYTLKQQPFPSRCKLPRNQSSSSPPVSEYYLDLDTASEGNSRPAGATKIIVAWTSLYEHSVWFESAYVDDLRKSGCVFTRDLSYVSVADLVVFHGCFQQRAGFHYPPKRNASQIYIYLNSEAPTSRYCRNSFIPADGIFNATATYKQDSDVIFSYAPSLRRRPVPMPTYASPTVKKALAFWYVSDCSSDWSSKRHRYVQDLRKFIHVDVYGSCWSAFPDAISACPKSKDKSMDECFLKLSSKYKFYLSFENAICSDYITEKLFKILQPESEVVPVVLGPSISDYQKVAPPDSFIHVKNFSSPERLAAYLKYLDSNDGAYNAYHKWRSTFYYDPLPGRNSIDQHPPSQLMQLCRLAHSPPRSKVWHRLSAWFSVEKNCRIVDDLCTEFGICTS